jgi:hypothetical protein
LLQVSLSPCLLGPFSGFKHGPHLRGYQCDVDDIWVRFPPGPRSCGLCAVDRCLVLLFVVTRGLLTHWCPFVEEGRWWLVGKRTWSWVPGGANQFLERRSSQSSARQRPWKLSTVSTPWQRLFGLLVRVRAGIALVASGAWSRRGNAPVCPLPPPPGPPIFDFCPRPGSGGGVLSPGTAPSRPARMCTCACKYLVGLISRL